MDESESRIEIAALNAKIVRLEARLDEDREFAAKKLELSLAIAKGTDVAALEAQIRELKAALAEEDAVIDRLVVYITRELRTP